MTWNTKYLTFDEFCYKYLFNKPVGNSLFFADEELLNYYEYLMGERFDTLIWPTPKDEHLKLEEWFKNNFLHQFHEDSFDKLELFNDQFIDFRKNLIELCTDKSIGFDYSNDAILKKVLYQVWLKDTVVKNRKVKFLPYLIDDINYLDRGSTFFYYELFWKILTESDNEILTDFQQYVLKIGKKYSTLKKPVLLVKPWKHQEDALASWLNNGNHGVIEMATATGKTVVGLYAALRLYDNLEKLDVLVLAHSHAILNQWRREAISKLGFPGNSNLTYKTPLVYNDFRIRFETLQTAYQNTSAFSPDFLIVDEVHHTAAYSFNKALDIKAKYKMGLSATIDGTDKIKHITDKLGELLIPIRLKRL